MAQSQGACSAGKKGLIRTSRIVVIVMATVFMHQAKNLNKSRPLYVTKPSLQMEKIKTNSSMAKERWLHHSSHKKGQLGNHLFQYASILGIAESNGMNACVHGTQGTVSSYFDGVSAADCSRPMPEKVISEDKTYAMYNSFSFDTDGDVVLDGFLQSFKYFPPNIKHIIRFKPHIQAEADAFLRTFVKNNSTTVGIHVRYKHQLLVSNLDFPPDEYFINVLTYFRSKYSTVQFIVVSDNPVWCADQPFFVAEDVYIQGAKDEEDVRKQKTAIDMAILAGCNHTVLTVGTFGWWAAYLGAGARGGEVVYYDSEFKMEHPTNKGNVVLQDYYPEGWDAMGFAPSSKLLSSWLET